MSYTEKAGNLLPQNEALLAMFIQAQTHMQLAARLIDEIRTNRNPKLGEKEADAFHNLSSEIRDTLWECYSDTQDLLHLQFAPDYPVVEMPIGTPNIISTD